MYPPQNEGLGAEMGLIDTHCHLESQQFEGEIAEVVKRARLAGVSPLITLGSESKSNQRSIAIAESFEDVFAAVGWQPQVLEEVPAEGLSAEQIETLRNQLRHPKVVAVGEIGLDYFRMPKKETPETLTYKRQQKIVLKQQLKLAQELNLPCCIHQRGEGTHEDCLELIRPYAGKVRMVMHCFVDGVRPAQDFLDLGCMFSFTGIVTFKNADELRETVKFLPLDRIMVETDSPYLAPVPVKRMARCEPAYVVHTAAKIAEVKGIEPEEVARVTTENAKKFFFEIDRKTCSE